MSRCIEKVENHWSTGNKQLLMTSNCDIRTHKVHQTHKQ